MVVKRRVEGYRVRNRMQFRTLVEGRQNWTTPFAKALCSELVRQELSGGDLWRRIGGVDRTSVTKWCHGGILPQEQRVRDIEDALGLEGGELEKFIPEGERTRLLGQGSKRMWATRKKNHRAKFHNKFLRGGWSGGTTRSEMGRRGSAARLAIGTSPRSLRGRIRSSVGHLIKNGRNFFALCAICQKVLYRKESWRTKTGHHFHPECQRSWRASGGNLRRDDFYHGTKPLNFRMFIFWLEYNILGIGYGEITRRHGANYRAVV